MVLRLLCKESLIKMRIGAVIVPSFLLFIPIKLCCATFPFPVPCKIADVLLCLNTDSLNLAWLDSLPATRMWQKPDKSTVTALNSLCALSKSMMHDPERVSTSRIIFHSDSTSLAYLVMYETGAGGYDKGVYLWLSTDDHESCLVPLVIYSLSDEGSLYLHMVRAEGVFRLCIESESYLSISSFTDLITGCCECIDDDS